MMAPRQRLKPDERRNQLLDIGAQFFATRPYEEVLMEQVGAAAGVSRALVYRYFPSKRDLFAAIYQRAADQLLAATEVDLTGSMADWVAAGLDAHIDYFVANSHTVLAANRELAGDPRIQGIISEELGTLRQRMLEATGLDGHRREIASVALLAWLSFVRTICVEWLQSQTISRAELRDVCLHALLGAVGSVMDIDDGPRSADPGQGGRA
jgi:AcrR family transcriptional regulator